MGDLSEEEHDQLVHAATSVIHDLAFSGDIAGLTAILVSLGEYMDLAVERMKENDK